MLWTDFSYSLPALLRAQKCPKPALKEEKNEKRAIAEDTRAVAAASLETERRLLKATSDAASFASLVEKQKREVVTAAEEVKHAKAKYAAMEKELANKIRVNARSYMTSNLARSVVVAEAELERLEKACEELSPTERTSVSKHLSKHEESLLTSIQQLTAQSNEIDSSASPAVRDKARALFSSGLSISELEAELARCEALLPQQA